MSPGLENSQEMEMPVILPEGYIPEDGDNYMDALQLEYFRQKLLRWRDELLRDSVETLHHLQDEPHQEADLNDRASTETDRAIELRTRDRERKLIAKIDEALERIRDGSFGYCEDSGDPIGIKRLEARPIATMSLESQERHERLEKTHRDD
jgi:DnaK suppressor protein